MTTTNLRQKAEQKGTIRTALFFAVLVISAQLIFTFHESTFRNTLGENHILAMRLSHIAFSIVVLATVLIYGHRLSARLIRTVPLLLAVPAFPLIWLVNVAYSRAQIRYTPFVGYKLICLALSLAPGPGVLPNAVLICGFTIEVVALWYFGGVGDAHVGTLSGEPWTSLLFGSASILIIILQNAYRRLHRQLGELVIRQRITEDLSGLSLAVRDKINSPLQTLEIGFDRLPKNEVAAACRKSLNTIEETVRLLGEFDYLINWEQKEVPAPAVLVKRLREDLQKVDVDFHLRFS